MNMQKRLLKKILQMSLILLFAGFQFVQAQPESVDWQGKISIGGNTTQINCNINLKETGKVYLRADSLQVFGFFSGENGSKVFIPANTDRHSFMDVSGTANGATEIIPELSDGWDGLRIELVKAQSENSFADVFQMQDIETDGFLVQLKNETRSNALVWFIEKTEISPCLPLIVQLGNHTLLANNNAITNGGYRFVHYAWYKNGVLLKEGAHANNGGSYYTGGSDLDENADYTVKVIDGSGVEYLSCPYRFVPPASAINVTAYPNPVPRNAKAYIQAETENITLLQNAVVDIYDMPGQYIGKANMNGQTLTSLNLPAKSGIYILKFRTKDFSKTIKPVVE
jgi:hypothetical protein